MDQQTIQELSCSGRHQECLQACQQLLQSEPESPIAWKYAGKSLLALEQFKNAQKCLTKAHQLNAKDPEITKDIGNIFLNLGRSEDATSWYKKSLEINNNYAPAINNIANIKRQSGNNLEAVNLFKQAIQADPQLVQAYAGAAASSLALGDLDQAESFAIRAIEINAHTPEINEILGIIFQNKKSYQQAVESYQRELVVNPKSNTSLLNLGLLLLQQGKAAEAIEPLTRAAAIRPSEQCSLLLAEAYQSIGNPKKAISEYQKIDSGKTQNKMIPFNLGLCLLSTGNNMDATEAFKIVISLDESFLPAWGNIGAALMNEGRYQEALPVMQKVLELDPNNPTAHMNLGGIYGDLGNLDQALASTLKSLELNPNNPDALMNLGGIYQDLGNLNQALASTLKSLELKPTNPDAHMILGGIYQDLGNLDKALASTLKSLELKPDNPHAHMNLGGIYKDFGNLDQALASTLKSLELKPNNPDAHMILAGIYRDLERIEDGKIAMNLALRSITKDTSKVTLILDFYDSTNEEELLEEAIIFLKNYFPNKSTRLTMYEARVLFRRKKYEESWAKIITPSPGLEDLNDWFSRSKYHKFRGQIAEKNKLYDEAYYSFEASKTDPRYKLLNHKIEHYRIHEYIALSKNMSKDRANTALNDQTLSNSHPIFLIGFPRSGTTLLDTVLSSHHAVEVVEEKDPLLLAETLGISNLQKQISNLNSLKEDDLNTMREAYNSRLKFHSKYANKFIIDKQPLHTIAIPLINLLFPNAKIVFALRHPCDSILSCFQQTFKPNNAMANFTNLEKSIDFYDKVMNGWTTYNEYLKIDYTISRYEDLVDTFDESVLKVLQHLNLPWDDRVREYRKTAKNRADIKTPSSSQVVQPLYKSSIGRWYNYRQHFSKHMDKLNHWINYFGYKT